MPSVETIKPTALPFNALASGSADPGSLRNRFADIPPAPTSLIDRLLSPHDASPRGNLTPVQQGEAARRHDLARGGSADADPNAPVGKSVIVGRAVGAAVGIVAGPVAGVLAGRAASAAVRAGEPIKVDSSITHRPDGTTVRTVAINVAANFRTDGGTLPAGQTAETRAHAIETAIERDFSKTYRDANGNVTRYVTNVDMTVNGADDPAREQFVLTSASDPRLGGGLGIAPGFEQGHVAYISDQAGARTAPHEFGHLAGLRHTAQVDQGCTTAPGINVENLMSQTGCSPTSQQLERSQLEQISMTPDFR